jgi:hypothetical protein
MVSIKSLQRAYDLPVSTVLALTQRFGDEIPGRTPEHIMRLSAQSLSWENLRELCVRWWLVIVHTDTAIAGVEPVWLQGMEAAVSNRALIEVEESCAKAPTTYAVLLNTVHTAAKLHREQSSTYGAGRCLLDVIAGPLADDTDFRQSATQFLVTVATAGLDVLRGVMFDVLDELARIKQPLMAKRPEGVS